MNDGDEKPSHADKLVEEIDNCHRIQFRVCPAFQEKARKIVYHLGFHVDGFSRHDLMRACLLFALEAVSKLTPFEARQALLKLLEKYKPKRGRPVGTPNWR